MNKIEGPTGADGMPQVVYGVSLLEIHSPVGPIPCKWHAEINVCLEPY